MLNFLKKHWPIMIIIILGGVLAYLLVGCSATHSAFNPNTDSDPFHGEVTIHDVFLHFPQECD